MAMIRPETEMKESGVQWLGNIPKEWSIGKVKHEFYATKTIVGDKVNDYERLALTLNGVIKRSKYAGDGLQPEKFDGYQILKEHELVFKLIDLANVSTSRVGLSPYTGIVSPAYIVLHHRKDMNPRYGEYYFLSMWMNEVFNHIGGDGVRSALNAKDLLNIPYLKVSPDEQQAIADYLDKTCLKIDEIIEEAKASTYEYKRLKQSILCDAVLRGLNSQVVLENSGASWIGMIPEHWQTAKLKWHLRRMDPKNPGEKEVLSLYRDYGVIPKNSRTDNHNVTSEDTSKYKYVRIGDFVVNKMKAWQGSVAVSDYEGIVSPAYYVYHFLDDVFNKRYFHHLLRSCYKEEFMRLSGGIRTGQWDLSSDDLDNIILLVPPKNEQDNIVEYLDNRLPQIDSLIAEKESLINDLEAYKKSLIYEVVTGKRRVV